MLRKVLACAAVASFLAVNIATAHAATKPVYYKDRVAVLLYHAFERPKESPIMVTAKQLDDHLRTLKAAGFHFITPDQFRAWKMNKGTVPPNAVLVTIDDGWREIRTVALPIFKKYQVPAVAFVMYGRVDRSANSLTLRDLHELDSERTRLGPVSHLEPAPRSDEGREASTRCPCCEL